MLEKLPLSPLIVIDVSLNSLSQKLGSGYALFMASNIYSLQNTFGQVEKDGFVISFFNLH